ncbi:ATP synthase subunit O, mitochondrial [Ananas comosus]|uniref:ATP synthase subunit O, mitochondrial n=1 Tax=Ananas comosus TaxID=4615 RepID=A0A6P5EYK8_ANACO|nr:ATP synthase subunit O, mitochondrial [Ananas comosus]
MALYGRLRSGLPLFRRLLRPESIVPLRSLADPGLGNPNLPISEGSRNFATQTKPTEVKTKVPLSLFGGSGNYASALFLAASKANILDKVESEILDVVEASKRSPVFSQFIKDLSVPKGTRVKAINEIFSEAGFSDVTKNFLAVLADNGRLKYIERIAKRFVDLTMAHRGEVKVIVTSVIPLPAEEEKELKQTLQDILGQGKTVKVEQKIDPSILGGLVVEFGQKVFDMSIRTRAKQMEKLLREPLHV